MSQPPTEQQLNFYNLCYECLVILKQHFPSRIDITTVTSNPSLASRLESIGDQKKAELSRRYISKLRTMLDKVDSLSADQVQEIGYLVRTEQSQKVRLLALSILSRIDDRLCIHLKDTEVDKIEELAANQEFSRLASILLSKILRAKTSLQPPSASRSRSVYDSRVKFDEPNLLKSALFQLRQSLNLDRAAFLIDKFELTSMNAEDQLKVDNGFWECAEKFVNNQYMSISGSRSVFNFGTTVLKYLVEKRRITNFGLLIKLLNKCLDDLLTENSLRKDFVSSIESFCSELQGRLEQKYILQLMSLIQQTVTRETFVTKNKSIHQQGRTSRDTSRSYKRTGGVTRSTFINP